MDKYKKRVIQDCTKAVAPTVLFNVIDIMFGSLLTVYIATVLAKFTDAVFKLDFSYGIANFKELLICILILLFIMPIFGTIKEVLLFSNSLKHDRMIYGRYLDKKYREAKFFEEGELQYRLEQDAIDLRCSWLDLVTQYISIPIILCYLLYNSFSISVLYTILIFLISAFRLLVPIATRKLNSRYDKEKREYQTQVRSYETEIMSQPHIVKLYGLTFALMNRLNTAFFDYFHKIYKKSIKFTIVSNNISSMLDTFCTLMILLVGAVMTSNQIISAGEMVAMLGFNSVSNTLLSNITAVIRDTPIFGTIVDRMTVFYKDEEYTAGESISEMKNIEVKNLSFSYGDKETFSNVSFTINKGDKVAVCGHNGSGKSTLIKVLCGLLKGYKGNILINGQELSSFAICDWYKIFAYTEQDSYLFSGTIRENIHLGNLNATEAELNNIIQEVGIEYLADRQYFPGNNKLSGGEKQKISIARALIKNTPILIMDEPSNNLDSNTIDWLNAFIINSSKTIIFVSHDDKILKYANFCVCL